MVVKIKLIDMKVQNVLNTVKVAILENVVDILSKKRIVTIAYNNKKKAPIFDIVAKIKKKRDVLVTYNEAYQLFMCVKNTGKVKGDIAEVGVYKGGTAEIIARAKSNKKLHLFDTFEGLPRGTKYDVEALYEGRFNTVFQEVKDSLKGEKEIYFYKGLFPFTAKAVEKSRFSFVHLDVDLYKSTLDCLKFFYPRMNKGGIILCHDYPSLPGISKAFDEFFAHKLEPVIEMSSTQCLIVKT